MAVRYDRELNKEIWRTVKNFNAKITRWEKKGYVGLPRRLRTADIKTNFTTRKALKNELKFLKTFSQREALSIVNFEGQQVYKWSAENFKRNYTRAENYYQQKKDIIKKVNKNRPVARKTRLKTANVAVNILRGKKGKSRYKPSFYARQNIMYNYYQRASKTRRFRRQFNISLQASASMVGLDDKQIKQIIDMLSDLSDSQFEALYENEDLITRIFQMHPSDSEMWQIFGNDAQDLIMELRRRTNSFVKAYS